LEETESGERAWCLVTGRTAANQIRGSRNSREALCPEREPNPDDDEHEWFGNCAPRTVKLTAIQMEAEL
jgi:hypothetical protein